jgi:hypothetical protein
MSRQTYLPTLPTTRAGAEAFASRLLDFHRQTFGDARMEEGAATREAATEPATAATGAATEAAAEQAATAAFTWDGKVESLPAEVQKIITDARADAGKARTTAKQQAADAARADLLTQIAPALKSLGIEVPGGEAALTPEQLTQQLATEAAARQSEAEATKNLQREHQVLLSAVNAGADHKRLLDSRSFLAKVSELDPTAEDFTTKVDAAVTAALTADTTLKAARAAGASSVEHAGGSGEGAAKPTTLADAIAQKMAG